MYYTPKVRIFTKSKYFQKLERLNFFYSFSDSVPKKLKALGEEPAKSGLMKSVAKETKNRFWIVGEISKY